MLRLHRPIPSWWLWIHPCSRCCSSWGWNSHHGQCSWKRCCSIQAILVGWFYRLSSQHFPCSHSSGPQRYQGTHLGSRLRFFCQPWHLGVTWRCKFLWYRWYQEFLSHPYPSWRRLWVPSSFWLGSFHLWPFLRIHHRRFHHCRLYQKGWKLCQLVLGSFQFWSRACTSWTQQRRVSGICYHQQSWTFFRWKQFLWFLSWQVSLWGCPKVVGHWLRQQHWLQELFLVLVLCRRCCWIGFLSVVVCNLICHQLLRLRWPIL